VSAPKARPPREATPEEPQAPAPKLFEVVNAGFVRAKVSDKVKLNRWQTNVDLNPHTGPVKLLEDKGHRVVHLGTHLWAEGFACRECGAERRTAAGTPSCKIIAGTYGPGLDSSSSSRVSCEACKKWVAPASRLVGVLYPEPKERLAYLEQNCRAAEPKTQRFTKARYKGTTALHRKTQSAIGEVLPPEFEPEVELCLIEAIDEPMALTIAQDVPEDAWVTVPLTDQAEPRVLSWHGQKPSTTERVAYERGKDREDQQRRAEIEREIQQLRREKLQQAGLRG
jgi:hypothetical protein